MVEDIGDDLRLAVYQQFFHSKVPLSVYAIGQMAYTVIARTRQLVDTCMGFHGSSAGIGCNIASSEHTTFVDAG